MTLPNSAETFGFSRNRVGGHTSRSMMLTDFSALIHHLGAAPSIPEIEQAVLDENILDKPTESSRVKSLRHLKELYGLDYGQALFRRLWESGKQEPDSLPLLCLVCVYCRDKQLRHSFSLIQRLRLGEVITREEMEEHLEEGFPDRFSDAMKKSLAQNVNTTWTHSGHLEGKAKKRRTLPGTTPAAAAYAMLAGYLSGLRGNRLIDSGFARLVAPDRATLLSRLSLASARGLLSLKQAGEVVEFDFSSVLTPQELAHAHV